MKTTILRNSIPSLLPIPVVFVCFALSPVAEAVKPPPDGGYPNNNTAEGSGALFSLTTGTNNTALGARALFTNSTGNYNTAVGSIALERNQNGYFNTATGVNALFNNTTGHDNTATGVYALFSNTGATADNRFAGSYNTANGSGALKNNSTGNYDTAVGFEALFSNTSPTPFGDGWHAFQRPGQENTAIGFQALYSETTSRQNTAIGSHAMYTYDGSFILPGWDGHNTAIGSYALYNISSQCIWNIALGADAGLNLGSFSVYNIDIGNPGVGGDENTIRIGTPPQDAGAWVEGQSRTFIAGIRGVTTDNDDGIPVVIDSAGQLGTTSSSARFKTDIKPMNKVSEAILALKPVTFHYKSHKSESESTARSQFGLIAEEVAKVNPDLVVPDEKGEIYTVRYEAVNAMLLNEFLKEHRKVQELKSTVSKQEATAAQQQKEIKALTAALKEQAAQIQKVSAQVKVSKPAPQVVVSDR